MKIKIKLKKEKKNFIKQIKQSKKIYKGLKIRKKIKIKKNQILLKKDILVIIILQLMQFRQIVFQLAKY